MAENVVNAKINISVEGASKSVADLKKFELQSKQAIEAMEGIRKTASTGKGGIWDWEKVDEGARDAVVALQKVRDATDELTKFMNQGLNAQELASKQQEVYEKTLQAVEVQTRKNIAAETAREAAMGRFREQMKQTGEASTGVKGALQGVREALDSQETGMKKVVQVGSSLFNVYNQVNKAIDVLQGSGNVFNALRIGVAGTAEDGNRLVGFLDMAAEKLEYLQTVSKYGFKFTAGIQQAQQLVRNLDDTKTAAVSLQDVLKGIEGVNFASLSQAMQRASNNAKTFANEMKKSGKVDETSYRNTRAELDRVTNSLENLRQAAIRQFGEGSQQVEGINQLIGRYRELDREVEFIADRYDGTAKAASRFLGINLEKLPLVGKAFKKVSADVQETAKQVQSVAERSIGFRKSVDGTVGPMNQLGAALHLVNQDTQTAQFGFTGLTQGLVASTAVIGGLAGALGGLDPAFAAVIGGAAAMSQRVLASLQVMTNAAASERDRFKATMVGLGSILTGFGGAALAGMVSLGKYAADVEATFVGLKVTARNAGVSIDIINEKIEQLKDTGIQTDVAISSLMQFLKAELPIDQVNDLASAAQDLAKSMGQNSSETLQRFIYFIQTGNSALLDAIGIAKNASVMYEEYAATIGKTGRTLTVMEQRQALINGLMKETASVSGIYSEAAKTVGGQLQSMKRHFNELRLEIGKQFQPILLEIVTRFSELLKTLRNMPDSTKQLIGVVTAATAVFGTLLGVFLLMAPSLTSLIGLFGALGLTINTLFPILGLLSVALIGLFALFKSIPSQAEGVAGIAEKLGYIVDVVSEKLRAVGEALGNFFRPFIELVQYHLPRLEFAFQSFKERLQEMFAGFADQGNLIERILPTLRELAALLWHIVNDILYALEAALNQNWDEFWRRIGSAGIEALTALVTMFTSLIPQAFDWGKNLIFSFGRGLLDAARAAIPSVMNYVGGILGDFLRTRSPAKRGALKDIVKWGQGAASSFASGMGSGQTAISRGLGSFGGAFAGMSVEANKWGNNLTKSFAEGIAGQAGSAIVPAMDAVGGMISRFLKGASPPPEGVLSDIDSWGKTAFETFLSGFAQADFSIFDQAMGLVQTRLDNLYSNIKEKGSMIAGALLEARQVMAEGISGVRGGTLSLNDFVGLADRIATPVRDIFGVISKVLQAEAAQAEVQSLQDSIDAAREARREAIEAQQDRIKAIQKSIRQLQKEEKKIRDSIEEEAEKRLEAMGITIDPALLDALKQRLESASQAAKRAQLELEKIQSARTRYGINLISWEEINAQAAFDLAKQREEEARLAVEQEEAKQKQLDDVKKQVEEEKNAEIEAIQKRIENMQEKAEAEQERLEALQDADQEASRAEDKQLKAAQRHAQELAKQAQIAEAALKERLEQEKLLAELAAGQAEEIAETAEAMKEALQHQLDLRKKLRESKEGFGLDVKPLEQPELPGLVGGILEAAKTLLNNVGNAVYGLAKDILAGFGIDLDVLVANMQPFFDLVSEQFQYLKDVVAGVFSDPRIKEAWDIFLEALNELGKAFGLGEVNGKRFFAILVSVPVLALAGAIRILAEGFKMWSPVIRATLIVFTFLVKVLTGVVKTVKWFVGEVIGFFEKLFNKLIGHSIIPELINGIIEWFVKLPQKVYDAIKDFVDSVLGPIEDLVGDVGDAASDIVDAILGPLDDLLKNPPEVTLKVLTEGMDTAKTFVDNVTAAWTALLGTAKEETKKLVATGFDGVKDLVSGVTTAWQTLVSSAGNTLKTLSVSGITTEIRDLMNSVWSAWTNLFNINGYKSLVLAVSGIAQSVSDAIYNIWANWYNMLIVGGSKTISLVTSGIASWVSSTLASIYNAWWPLLQTASTKSIFLYLGGLFDSALNVVRDIVGLFERVVAAWRTFLGLSVSGASLNVALDPGSLVPLTAPGLEIDASLFQRGGIVLGKTLSVLGEAGPEAVLPLSRLPQILQSLNPVIERNFVGGQTLTYAPVLNFYGNPEPGQVRREVVQAGDDWVFQVRR